MKAKQQNYNKGRFGEEIAKSYLLEKGYEWVESNFENKLGEIDIIMTDNDRLVFVEVKYKTDDLMGLPEEMISKGKLSRIKKIAESYLVMNSKIKWQYKKYRIDAVCILGEKITHYQNLY